MAQTADIERVLRILEIALAIGRNIVLAAWAFAGINIALVAYNFAAGNFAWGMLHSLLALAGLVFIAQVRKARRRHRNRQAWRRQTPVKYHQAASA